jgi:DNA oxidative demethylase
VNVPWRIRETHRGCRDPSHMSIDPCVNSPPRRRSRHIAVAPHGFRLQTDFLSFEQEQELLPQIARLPFEAVRLHGVVARRQVVHYGVRYDYEQRGLTPAPAVPAFLMPLQQRVRALAGWSVDQPLEMLATRYPPGAGIGWHRDAPSFGAVVVGISLGATCEFRLRYETPSRYDVYRATLAPRSLYLLAGSARFRWQHAIQSVPALRYSVTFRSVRARATEPHA